MEKQTAVEWLHETFVNATQTELKDNINLFFKQAKEMEKDQIMNSWAKGVISDDNMTAIQYYNETFKK